MWREKRVNQRHVIELPIKYRVLDERSEHRAETRNFSETGLLFLTPEHFESGALLAFTLQAKDKIFTVKGRVVYSTRDEEASVFRTGVQFLHPESLFLVKMAEQLHQIDQYRRTLSRKEGHPISEEEAAERWIHDHSKEFSEFYK